MDSFSKFRWIFRRKLASSHHSAVALVAGCKPLPLRYWMLARSILGVLSPSGSSLGPLVPEVSGASIDIAELSPALSGGSIGGWALDAASIKLLWSSLLKELPDCILEFGSGKSTVMLAKYAETRRPETVTVVSLEQGADARADTERLLADSGLAGLVNILTCPVDEAGAYRASAGDVAAALGGRRPTWILIDGPYGPPGCRADTLLRFGSICAPNCRWFLHDSFRDGEMQALMRWSRTPGLRVDGIFPVGMGLATGAVTTPGKEGTASENLS